jgi:hypothetical protein
MNGSPGAALVVFQWTHISWKGECTLKLISRQQQPPEASVTENAKNELVKRVRKLRWVGEEEEAEKAQRALGEQTPSDSVLAMPRETD